MKLRVRFKCGLSKLIEYDAPRGEAGYYVPHEFYTAKQDGGEKILVRSDPVRTQNSKYPVYIEADEQEKKIRQMLTETAKQGGDGE